MADTVPPKAAAAPPAPPPVLHSPAPSAATPEADVQPSGALTRSTVALATPHVDSPPPSPIRPHGVGIRGLTLSRGSQMFDGRFGRIFRSLPAADFGANDDESAKNLAKLAAAMVSPADPADPKDGADNEESGIPAVYTYFGQFIDHDLTFDPASSLMKQDDPDALVDFRTPRFDLDNVYGRGQDDQPYMYDGNGKFLQGRALTGAAANPNARDLPRSAGNPARAIIGDPRNDENVIVSQLQGLLHRFHNKAYADLAPQGFSFEEVQTEVRWHYQWVLIHDFLPTLVHPEVFNDVLPHVAKNTDVIRDKPNLRFYRPRDSAFMPLEFSVAAYRFGHSMVRPGYRLSESIKPLSVFTPGGGGLTGFQAFPSSWAIDWNLFADLAPRDPKSIQRTQLAYRIDTSIANPLGALPKSVGFDPSTLALRNLLRGWRLRLPTGQDVARTMGVTPLADDEILIGKFTGDPADIVGPITKIDPVFKNNCPLWTYILAETNKNQVETVLKTTAGNVTFKTPKLGPVGGRIVMETFVGILLADSSSYLSRDPLWKPDYAINGRFHLADLIATALKA